MAAASPPDPGAAPAAIRAPIGAAERLQADRVRVLFQQGVVALAGNAVGMALIGAMFWPYAPRGVMLAWLGTAFALWLARLAHYLRFRRSADPDAATLLRWRSSWRALVLLQGSVWGVAVWLFYGLGDTFHLIGLVVAVFSYCLGTVQMLATQTRVFVAFISLVLVPAIVRVATDASQPWHWQLAGVLCLLFALAVLMGRAYRGTLDAAVRLKVRSERLAEQLRVEKAAADDARRAAEAASLAKTQFFAAASHDLRQPLHAMGLFAEALLQRSRDPETTLLVQSMSASVEALEGLFAELLDLTRIDSGGVDVRPQPVAVRELFARLKLHFAPIAFEKGLALDFHGERHTLHTDPVLIERILRNLVSNAIRYTEDGGVLVACRPRGERLLLQVWDSGVGIDDSALPHVFDEFYQVRSAAADGRRPKGLGLGLAIVKRLAGLLGAPLGVRSVPGRGSVFELQVARGQPQTAAPAEPKLAPTLERRTIVVIEDEATVREGLVAMLEGWGADVLAFDSLAAVECWARGRGGAQPDLLICDHRLPGQRTGVEAIRAVRAERGAIPALLVSGGAPGDAGAVAEEPDVHVLVKPVVPTKLRALIAFKLGVR